MTTASRLARRAARTLQPVLVIGAVAGNLNLIALGLVACVLDAILRA